MDYKRHYDKLISRAKSRSVELGAYYETHHIVPRCMGGDNSKTNLVKLYAREHFIAHLLLMKMYPTISGLALTVRLMSRSSYGRLNTPMGVARSENKCYEWMRKRIQPFLRESGHLANLGKVAITNGVRNRRIYPSDPIPDGWHLGYVVKTPDNGYASINNGVSNSRIPRGDAIPDGWHEGWLVSGDAARGLKWATDGKVDIRVDPKTELSPGFHWGRTFAPVKDLICMTDGVHNRRVTQEEADALGDEWHVGIQFKAKRTGSIRITDGVHSLILPEGSAIPEGWRRGMIKKKPSGRPKL